jgi:hypothetical protein
LTGFAEVAAAGEEGFGEEAARDEEEPQAGASRASAPSPTEPTRTFFLTLPLNMTEFIDIQAQY